MTKSTVYFGSIKQGKHGIGVSLGTKYDILMEKLDFSTIKKNDKVAVKMHLGFKDGFQTIPVFFIRRLVKKLKKIGCSPFITDNPTAVYNAVDRGYTQETCGCPIIPIAGLNDQYYHTVDITYRTVDKMKMTGVLHDADALINLSHFKGHATCGYGGHSRTLHLEDIVGPDRWTKIHGVENSVKWYNPEKLTPDHVQNLVKSCPTKALSYDEKKKKMSNEWHECFNGNCRECLKADEGTGALCLSSSNFSAFHELMSIAASKVLDTFDKSKVFHLNYLLDITPQCDCIGQPQPIVLPDMGIMGSRDIVAVEKASLDIVKDIPLIESMIPLYFKMTNLDPLADLHPFQRLFGSWKNPYLVCDFGEKLELGSCDYELVEILSPEETLTIDTEAHEYENQPTFF